MSFVQSTDFNRYERESRKTCLVPLQHSSATVHEIFSIFFVSQDEMSKMRL